MSEQQGIQHLIVTQLRSIPPTADDIEFYLAALGFSAKERAHWKSLMSGGLFDDGIS